MECSLSRRTRRALRCTSAYSTFELHSLRDAPPPPPPRHWGPVTRQPGRPKSDRGRGLVSNEREERRGGGVRGRRVVDGGRNILRRAGAEPRHGPNLNREPSAFSVCKRHRHAFDRRRGLRRIRLGLSVRSRLLNFKLEVPLCWLEHAQVGGARVVSELEWTKQRQRNREDIGRPDICIWRTTLGHVSRRTQR